LALLAVTIASSVSHAEQRTLYHFKAPLGATPRGALIEGPDGNLYGTTYGGGEHHGGTAFRMTPEGTVTTLHSFNRWVDGGHPVGPLVLALDGNFYGTTQFGGTQGPVSQGVDGGTIFRMTPAGAVTVVHAFTGGGGGSQPSSGLALGADGTLYGTTRKDEYYENGGGVIFSLTTSGTFTILKKFPTTGNGFEGNEPYGGLLYASDGNLYGMTQYGGSLIEGTQLRPCGNAGCGVIYRITPTGEYTKLYEFKEGQGGQHPMTALIQASDGYLYGMTSYDLWPNIIADGTSVFRMSLGGEVTHVAEIGKDDLRPNERLLEASDGNFYLTTPAGGSCLENAYSCGLIFRITKTGAVSIVHTFDYNDGAVPFAGLIQASDGALYGVTQYGGRSENGTTFKLTLGGTLTTLNHFDNTFGAYPTAGLARDAAGDFYGTTYLGGAFGLGTVYKITAAGALTVLHSFSGSDGANPRAGVRLASDGNLYGTTEAGGAQGYGTIYVMTPAGELTVMHSFNGLDGAYPQATLMEASDGRLYGTAEVGGPGGYGTVFSITPYNVLPGLSGLFTTEAAFDYLNGAYPVAGVVEGSDGNFYGATADGGPNTCGNGVGCGTFFKMTPAGVLTTLHFFDCCIESQPYGTPIQASDGHFYGTTYGVLNQQGSVYKVTLAGELTTLYSFNTPGSTTAAAFAGLIQGTDGALYGTSLGGDHNVYRLTLDGQITGLGSGSALIIASSPYGVLVEGEPGHFYGTYLTGDVDSGDIAIHDRGRIFEVVVKPELKVPVTSLDLGTVKEGAHGGNGFALTAIGNAPVTLAFAIDGDEGITQTNDCNGGLAAYRQCNVFVHFSPTQPGPHTGTLTITSNTEDSPHAITLSGTATAAAFLTQAPGSLSFADQDVATTSDPQSITFRNGGSLSMTLGPIVTGSEFPSSHNCPSTLAPDAECVLAVRFKPSTPGSRLDNVTVFCSPDCTRNDLRLSGTGVGAMAWVSPDYANFGNRAYGSTTTQAISLTNTGNVALEIDAIAITGDADFTQSNNCGSSLEPASGCTITLSFVPTQTTYRSGVLRITSNAANGTKTLNLSGYGTGATATPTVLAFGDQGVGGTGADKYVTLGNNGGTAFDINGIAVTGDFSYTSACGASLGNGSSCLIAVRFAPATMGAHSGSLTIQCSSASCPLSVPLTGTGRAVAMSASPGSLTFADRTVGSESASQDVTLTNTGNLGTPIALTLAGDYTLAHNCSSSLGAGLSCVAHIRFRPTAEGPRNGTLSVATNAAGSPLVVPLSGAGLVGAVSLSSTTLSFAEQQVDTMTEQEITLTNTGAGDITFETFQISGASFSGVHTCGHILAAGNSCGIDVRFTPPAGGTYDGTLVIYTDAPGSPHVVTLTGSGAVPSSDGDSDSVGGGGGGGFGAGLAWLLAAAAWRVRRRARGTH
jgi:uncharacterized repeat protein (TIGR03803 family)